MNKKKHEKRIGIIRKGAVFFVCIMLLAGCAGGLSGHSGERTKQEKTEIHIGYFPNITHAQALVMKAKGLLEAELGEEYEITWVSFSAGPSEVTALFAGEIDIGYIGPVPAISANVNSEGDIRIIAGGTEGGAVLVAGQSENISEIKDLAGKTVAVPQFGNTQHLCLLKLLKENNLSVGAGENQVNVVAVENAQVRTLLDRKEIDAAFVPEPWGSILESCGAAKVLSEGDELGDEALPVAVVVGRKEFLDENREVSEKFLEVHEQVSLMLQQEELTEAINQEIAAVTGSRLDREILNKSMKRIGITTKIEEDTVMDLAKLTVEAGFVYRMPAQEIVDKSFQPEGG